MRSIGMLFDEALDNMQPVHARAEAFNLLAITVGRQYKDGNYTDQNDLIEDLLDIAANKDESTWDRLQAVKSVSDIIVEVTKKSTWMKRQAKRADKVSVAQKFAAQPIPDFTKKIPHSEVVQQVIVGIAEDGTANDELRVAAIDTYIQIRQCYASLGIENLQSKDGRIRRLPYIKTTTPAVSERAKMAVS